jgi:hypothetical protein
VKRLRHVLFAAEQRKEQIRGEEQQATPIYDAIAQALYKWNIMGLTNEDTVVWLLQQLPEAHDVHSVERLIMQAFADQHGSHQFDPEDVLLMRALAEDIWHAWSQYLQRHETATFSHARARAQGLMSRHYYPRTNSR